MSVGEICEACGFDSRDYTVEDARGTLRSFGLRWRWMTEGLADATLRTRPAPATWSAVEYAAHSRDVTAILGFGLDRIIAEDRPVFDAPVGVDAAADDPPSAVELAEAVNQLEHHADALQQQAGRLSDGEWDRVAIVGGEPYTAAWVLTHAVHDAEHHLVDVGRGLHLLGAFSRQPSGAVAQVNASDGGVPKRAVRGAVAVGRRGLSGDRQADRRHHGRPSQALCLWSSGVIDGLRAEGHPIEAGSAGENVTVSGIDWSRLRPGMRLQLGTALAEITGYAIPCNDNARWFTGRDFHRIDHDRYPGSSRIYARVVRSGRVQAGDAVLVEP